MAVFMNVAGKVLRNQLSLLNYCFPSQICITVSSKRSQTKADTAARFSSVSLASRAAASVQQTTRVPAPRSWPLSTIVWSSLYINFYSENSSTGKDREAQDPYQKPTLGENPSDYWLYC
ncbi:hypothetical protein Y032_0061g3269 [Ancylostoma ceylanicum]|uniref:Uncharacterized protein n=1 Tax=Ancylostoma ceylanicum TaxID=53326 RepID=A0A016U2F4_9BILA|nr:hypothetical protein Y032_0061g3269 [Ancylostoma ceylanicum]